jgi:hypothetical protein
MLTDIGRRLRSNCGEKNCELTSRSAAGDAGRISGSTRRRAIGQPGLALLMDGPILHAEIDR